MAVTRCNADARVAHGGRVRASAGNQPPGPLPVHQPPTSPAQKVGSVQDH